MANSSKKILQNLLWCATVILLLHLTEATIYAPLFPEEQNVSSLCFVSGCTQFTKPPHEIQIGVFINNLADVRSTEYTARMDFYYWIKWHKCTVDSEGEVLRPDLTLYLHNANTRVDVEIDTTYGVPVCDADASGDYAFKLWRAEGVFNQHWSYRKYPLDSHEVLVVFEDIFYASDQLYYVNDNASARADIVTLSGWQVGNITSSNSTNIYDTNFGADNPLYSNQDFSQFQLGIRISRSPRLYLLKVLPPIVITLAVSLFVFFLDLESVDVRIATAVAGLLAEIFLQLTYSTYLPNDLDYLTLLDVIFDICYILILIVILECIIVIRLYFRALRQEGIHDPGEHLSKKDLQTLRTIRKRYKRIDRIAVIAVAVVGTLALVGATLIIAL